MEYFRTIGGLSNKDIQAACEIDWNGETSFEFNSFPTLGGYTLTELEFLISLPWSSIPEFHFKQKENNISMNKSNISSETSVIEDRPSIPEVFIRFTSTVLIY